MKFISPRLCSQGQGPEWGPISSAQGLASPELIKYLLSDVWTEHQASRQKASLGHRVVADGSLANDDALAEALIAGAQP